MGIKFRCPDCQKKIHVKSYLAGKKGVCPTCGAKVQIPTEIPHEADDDDVLDVHQPDPRDAGGVHRFTPASKIFAGGHGDDELATAATTITKGPSPLAGLVATADYAADPFASIPAEPVAVAAPVVTVPVASVPVASIPVVSAPVASVPVASVPVAAIPTAAIPAAATPAVAAAVAGADPLAEDPQANWYVRLAAGDQYGPAKAPEMQQWLGEGRILPDALVWREGWGDWKRADATFARFGAVQPAAPAAPPVVVQAAPAMAAVPQMQMAAPAVAMAAPAVAMAGVPQMQMIAPQIQVAVPGMMMAAAPAGIAAPAAAMPVGTLAVRTAPVAVVSPAPAAAAPAATGLAATLATTSPAKEEEASQDTMELLKSVGNTGGGGGGGGGGGKPGAAGTSSQAPAYYPPQKSNTPMIVMGAVGGIAALAVVVVLVIVLMNQPGGSGGSTGGSGFLGNLTGGGGDWQTVSEPEHGFSAKFPTKPGSTKTQEQTMAGLLKGTRYTSDQRNSQGYAYIVAVADITDPTAAARRADEFYKESSESAGKLVTSTQITAAGSVKSGEYNGRAYTIEGRGDHLVTRIFVAGKRRFTVAVIAVGSRKTDAPNVEQFFDSFKITDAGTPERPRPMKKE